MIMEKDSAIEELAVFMDMFEINVGANLTHKIQATSEFLQRVESADLFISLEDTARVNRKHMEKKNFTKPSPIDHSFTCG